MTATTQAAILTPRQATSNGDLRAILQAAKKRGWVIENHGGPHNQLRNAGHMLPISSTPSDVNAVHHVRRDIARCERGECKCPAGPIEAAAAKFVPLDRSVSHMSTKQCAEFFGLSTAWVTDKIKAGELESLEPLQRFVQTKITLDSIERLEAKRAKEGKPRTVTITRAIAKANEASSESPGPVVAPVVPQEDDGLGEDGLLVPPLRATVSMAPADLSIALAKLEGFALGRDDEKLMGLVAELRASTGS